jgi:hypothetical protein
MTLIIPAPPGEAVGFDDSRQARLAPRSTRNVFVVSTFDRGLVAQFADAAGLFANFGHRVNYSSGIDETLTTLAEGAVLEGVNGESAAITAARAVGPAATAATVTLDDKIKVTASSPGAWANALDAEITLPSADTRRLVIYEAGSPIVSSPVFRSETELHAWSALPGSTVRTASVAAGLPAAVAKTKLVGGADDRANLGVAGWKAAIDRLDARYGPGRVIMPGVTDLAVHAELIPHLAATNRIAELQLPLDVTKEQAIAHRQALAADFPDDHWRVAPWASHLYARPVSGDPDRLVGWSAVQTGIASYVEGAFGIGVAPFGLEHGVSTTGSRLYREWTTGHTPPGELQELYAEHVNAAYDNGQAIYAKGYRTADGDPLREDMHVAGTRMRLAWRSLQAAERFGSHNGDMLTLAQYETALTAICEEFATARAFNTDRDKGFRVVVGPLNTRESLARRELHGRIFFRPNGSIHWTDVLVGSVRPTEQI